MATRLLLVLGEDNHVLITKVEGCLCYPFVTTILFQ